MVTPSYTVACLSNRLIARNTWEFRMEKPNGFAFKPGQFVLFKVPLVDHPDDIQPRAFSIASAPSEDNLSFVAKMKAGGRASRWIAELLTPGTTVTFQGPFGNFVLKESDRPILFIATSTGVAPFRSMLADMAIGKWQMVNGKSMDLIFGFRLEEDIFWLDELKEYLPEDRIHISLTRPSPSWQGRTGRVQTLISSVAPDIAARSVYVCGNPNMTKELKELCLGWGVAREHLHVEGYI